MRCTEYSIYCLRLGLLLKKGVSHNLPAQLISSNWQGSRVESVGVSVLGAAVAAFLLQIGLNKLERVLSRHHVHAADAVAV